VPAPPPDPDRAVRRSDPGAAEVPAPGAELQDPTRRFGPRADAYARARPGYPDDLVARIAEAVSLPADPVVVDLGCGTGLSCAPFLRAGWRVIGIEPNASMRAHAQERGSSYPRFSVHEGRAEQTGLARACADLVIAAQAFHWFDVPGARAEALRILRPSGYAALIWNDRRAEGSEFARGYEALVREFSPDYLELRHRHRRIDRVAEFFGHAHWQTLNLSHGDPLDRDTLADRLNSASYMPPPGDPRHAAMMERLDDLFRGTQAAGVVRMEFETRVLVGALQGRAAGQARS
jgi:SAM-dependent methyltransferase